MIPLKKIPGKIQKVLKQLKKSESELGEFCIEQVADALAKNGYADSKLWAANILSAMLGDFEVIESAADLEPLLVELDGPEHDAVEAMYYTLSDLEESLEKTDPADIKDALVYSVEKTIDSLDREKYKRLYG